MNPTGTIHEERTLEFLRTEQPFSQFLTETFRVPETWLLIPLISLFVLAVTFTAVTVIRRFTREKPTTPGMHRDSLGTTLKWTTAGMWFLFLCWLLTVFFFNDTFPRETTSAPLASRSTNKVLWWALTGGLFTLGSAYTIAMYRKDARSVHWGFASALAGLRITVYALLCLAFMLPAIRTFERVEKRSRVIVLLDISRSMTEIPEDVSGKKTKYRMDSVIDLLTDQNVNLLQNLLHKNPVVVYRFGDKLDEEGQEFKAGGTLWGESEWDAFAHYDLKPLLLSGLSEAGAEALRNSEPWGGNKIGNPEWATKWFARDEAAFPENFSDADKAILRENREKLGKRLDVVRSIASATRVPNAITQTIDREALNLAQGIIVFTDGRSQLRSTSDYNLMERRAREVGVPILTIAVGTDRESAAITITSVLAPENAKPDEPFKVIVEAEGRGLAGQEVPVELDIFGPKADKKADPSKDTPDHVITDQTKKGGSGAKTPFLVRFESGQVPHGKVEFQINPAELPQELTLVEKSETTGADRRVLKNGDWIVRARVKRHEKEPPGDEWHTQLSKPIVVQKNKLRILLIAGGPTQEYKFLRTLLFREFQEQRAELSIVLQSQGGRDGTSVQDVPPERLLNKIPYFLEDDPGKVQADKALYNLAEYNLIVAIDPDWSELTLDGAKAIKKWVDRGGGLVYIAGSINSNVLAQVEVPDKSEMADDDKDTQYQGQNGRLLPILKVLPVIPAEAVQFQSRTARVARRLYMQNPPPDAAELLQLDPTTSNDPFAGWEQYFTDREVYARDPDDMREFRPRRGFYSCYPVKTPLTPDSDRVVRGFDLKTNGLKKTAQLLAEFAYEDDQGKEVREPWIVFRDKVSGEKGRTLYLASGEIYRMFGYNRQFYERFWIKVTKFMAGSQGGKVSRGRVLIAKDYPSGGTIRFQVQVLTPDGVPYAPGAADPKFRLIQIAPSGDVREIGIYPLKRPQGETAGYFDAELDVDPRIMPSDKFRYRVEVDVPGGSEPLKGEFELRSPDPELDIKAPDYDALIQMASRIDATFQARLTTKPEVRQKLLDQLPKVAAVIEEEGQEKSVLATKLMFRIDQKELIALIPECMEAQEYNQNNPGRVDELWDRGFQVPESLTHRFFSEKQRLSYLLLLVVGLLSVEWMARKILRLA